MAKATYSQLTAQIAKLQAQADELRDKEKRGVVARIQDAIEAYQITPHELFGAAAKTGPKTRAAPKSTSKDESTSKPKSKADQAVRYSDGAGNDWVGRGPRPQWIRDALAAGKQLRDFAVGTPKPDGAAGHLNGHGKSKAAELVGTRRRAAKAKRKGVVKFSNGTQSWTGMGPQPKWLKEAVAGGKKLEDFAVR